MQPLSKLPVFFDLAGRRAIVAGGSAAAAWKAELLASAGAHVDIYAPHCEPEIEDLVARGAEPGCLSLHRRPWSVEIFEGARVALADCGTDDAARAFYCAAIKSGVPVNIIDKPAYCQFQFGSIVNRSPVVVGISTDGAAPILGQNIRRRIETLLPASLASWAQLAKGIRGEVARRLTPSHARRAFWERLSDKAFGGEPRVHEMDHLLGEMSTLEADVGIETGRVTLVGAGPGDPELLTLKAVRAMQSADVILFDDLVSEEVLELARREAKRMLVGKRGGGESCNQADINDLMVKLARQGKHVVRLKSGDPMVFGRAGEEIARLRTAGISVSIVPGITAASAMAAGLCTSLTHRDRAHSIRFVTGHSRHGELPADLDWRGLADAETTLVFYMGGRTAPAIASRLIVAGLDPDMPVVIQVAATRADGEVFRMTLREMAEAGPMQFNGRPTLIGIGRVFEVEAAVVVREENGTSSRFEATRQLESAVR